MARIFLAAVDSPRDHADLERSVGTGIDRQVVIRSFSDATYPELIDIERKGHGLYAWGVAGGTGALEAWFSMGIGDFVLLAQRDYYRYYARVLGRYENARAALAIWGAPPPEGELRQYLCFLAEPIPLAIPCRDLADYLPASFGELQPVPPDAMERIEADFGTIERFARQRFLNTSAGGPVLDMSGMIRLSERDLARLQIFDPQNSKEGRQAVIDTIIRRRGQPGFRQALLEAYERRCAVTNFSGAEALEAACIVPYRGKQTHHPSNGLLLRADVHTLFDLGKIAVDTGTMSIVIADDLQATSYRLLAGRPLRYPRDEASRPSAEALDLHRRLAGL